MTLQAKKIFVTGMLNRRSIAYFIAKACAEDGAELAFTCQNEDMRGRVTDLAREFRSSVVLTCDVTSDEQIANAVTTLGEQWGQIDGIVHSLAFAPIQSSGGDFIDTIDREVFRIANDVSAYSLIALAKAARPYFSPEASLVTLTFLGAERAVPYYNTMGVAKAALEASVRYLAASLGPMGVRVNAISAGAIRTASALAFPLLTHAMNFCEREAPLRRNVTGDEVGNVAAFLLSRRASGMTGEVVHVDCGFHAVAPGLYNTIPNPEDRP